MKKVVVVVVILMTVLAGTIAWKIRAQRAAENGPPGGSGVVEGEAVDVSARLGARITKILVAEGETIAEGGVVLTLECDEPKARLAEATARLAAMRAQVDGASAQAAAAKNQSRAAHASVSASGANVAALAAQRELALRQAGRVESLGKYAPVAEQDQARTTATQLQAQARAARASRSVTRGQAMAAADAAKAAEAQVEGAKQQVSAMEAAVSGARIAVAECEVRAPRAGTVERTYYEVGELVMPGSVVARIVDPSFVRATFYLPNQDVDAARVGHVARVEADAYPDRSFEATVRRVGLEAEFTPRNIQTRTDRDRLVFPVEVRIPNPEGLLRSGMPVTVTLGEPP